MLPSQTVLKTPTERRTNRLHKQRVNVKRLASKLAFAPETELVMWSILNSHTNLNKSLGEGGVKGVTIGTEILNFF